MRILRNRVTMSRGIRAIYFFERRRSPESLSNSPLVVLYVIKSDFASKLLTAALVRVITCLITGKTNSLRNFGRLQFRNLHKSGANRFARRETIARDTVVNWYRGPICVESGGRKHISANQEARNPCLPSFLVLARPTCPA